MQTQPSMPAQAAPTTADNLMFAKFDAALGKTTPTTSTGPVSTRADEIRALGTQTTDAAAADAPVTPISTAKDIGDSFNKRADNVGTIENSTDSSASKALQIGGQGAAVVNDTIGSVIKQVVSPDILKSLSATLSPAIQAAAAEPHVKSIIDWFGTLSPETQRNLSASGHIASLLSNAIGVGAVKKVGEVAADEGVQNAVKDAVAPIVTKVSDVAGTVKQAVKPTLSPQEAVGQVIQGKTADIPAAHRTLSTIDTTGVKTYADLQAKLKAEIKPLATQVDEALQKDTTAGRSIKSFEQTIGTTPANSVKVNYVKQAINDLRTFFTKTGDAQGLSDMKALKNKAKINGLTFKDVNDLARTHGSSINAFNANGEAASGLTKQAAENTRSGLKAIARQGLHGPEAQALDAKLSDLYDTQALIDKQVEKVNTQAQKTTKTGIVPKVVGKAIKTIDVLTGRPLEAIGHAMGNASSKGGLDASEIEANLMKNLKTIRGK